MKSPDVIEHVLIGIVSFVICGAVIIGVDDMYEKDMVIAETIELAHQHKKAPPQAGLTEAQTVAQAPFGVAKS